MSKMNPRVKAKWVAALRSGEYEQTEGTMKEVNAEGQCMFCCLGVLSDLHSKEFGKEWVQWVSQFSKRTYATYLGGEDMPPVEVNNWANANLEEVVVTINGITAELWCHNDKYKVPFNRLADAIEEQL